MIDLTEQLSSKLNGLTREFEIIAHNMANASTTGFKRKCNTFSQSLAAQGTETQAETDTKTELHSVFDFSQGNFIETGRSLDFALCGNGFFVIETPDGPLYTRNGMFRLDQNGQIADSSGRIVSGQAGPISIPPNVGLSQIHVSSDGSISAAGTTVGKFKLVDFKDKEGELVAAGLNCFQASETAEPQTPESIIIKQGFQENSNVQMVEELVDMIMVTRLYEANMKFMSVGKDVSESLLRVAMG